MTESNAKIMKIVLSLLAVVALVLIIVFAVSAGKDNAAFDDIDYSDDYEEVEDDGYDPMEDYEFSDEFLYDISGSDLSYSDLSESDLY